MVNMNNVLDQVVKMAGQEGSTKSMYEDMKANAGILDRLQYNNFIREIELNTTILADAAFKRMTRETEVVSGARITGRVLQDGYMKESRTTKKELVEAPIGFGSDELVAKKLKAKTSILDDDLEENIEGAKFESTLQSMMGAAMGEDLEYVAVFGDTSLDYDTQPLLHVFDGWIKKSTNTLKSSELGTTNATKNFNVHEGTIESMFDAIIRAIPPRIRQSNMMNQFTIYVPWEVEDAYRNLLKSRNTPLGDSVQTGNAPLPYKRFPVKYAPVLDAEDGKAIDNTATCIGAFPDLLRWGVYKDISMETERIASEEKTNFWYRMKCCAGLEVFSSLVTAKMTLQELSEIQDENKA